MKKLLLIGFAILSLCLSSYGQLMRRLQPAYEPPPKAPLPYANDSLWIGYTNQIGKLEYYRTKNQTRLATLELQIAQDKFSNRTNTSTVTEAEKLRGYINNQDKAIRDVSAKKSELEKLHMEKELSGKSKAEQTRLKQEWSDQRRKLTHPDSQ